MKPETIAGWQQRAASDLAPITETPLREAQWLLSAALSKSQAWVLTHQDELLAAAEVKKLNRWLTQRLDHVPLAYLTGSQPFWTLDLAVSSDTLVPRADSELLVTQALKRIDPQQMVHVADLGTGTGAIALAIASERPRCKVLATDISSAALALARQNAESHAIGNVHFAGGDWCAALGGRDFEVIVSNPPYVESGFADLDDKLAHEPRSALASGVDGLDDLRRICACAGGHLVEGGYLLLEHGHMQADALSGILRANDFVAITTYADLAGQPRVTEAQRRH